MKIDKKSLIVYDYKKYKDKYSELKTGIETSIQIDYLSIFDMKNWAENGIFCRRLKFRKSEGSFYITTASISRGNRYDHDFKFGEDFIIPYWGNQQQRAQSLMKFEIGEESPKNGTLDLIGDFTPSEDNLLDIKYQTISSKEFIKNAKDFLEEKKSFTNVNERIDVENFFRLKFEMAEQGLQARALYDESNCIIDGAAGTGKSTIAIQKLKYFIENNRINQSQLLIIVRNRSQKEYFRTLLKDSIINLENVKIQTIDETFDINDIESIEEFIKEAQGIQQQLNELIQKRDIDSLEKHYFNLFNHFSVEFFKKKISILLSQLNTEQNKHDIKKLNKDLEGLQTELSEYISLNRDEIAQLAQLQKNEKDLKKKLNDKSLQYNEKEQIKTKLDKIKKALLNKVSKQIKNYKKDIRNYEEKIDKLEGKHYQKLLRNLTSDSILPISILDDLIHLFQNRKEAISLEVLKWFIEYKNYLLNKEKLESTKSELESQLKSETSIQKQEVIENEIIDLDKKIEKKFENANRKYFDLYSTEMKKVYFSEQYLSKSGLIQSNQEIIYTILNIMPKQYNTVIIDEAQDFSKQELEYIRIHTERVILTGDILQNIEANKGLKKWSDILSLEQFRNDNEELNIHSLKHNFRQTYQLANASYNYRQLLLDQKIEDIGFDYFENEKFFNGEGYPKPKVLFFGTDLDAMEYFDSKRKYISSTYTERFPIVAVYKDDKDIKYYENVFSDYSIEKEIDKHADIILLHINDIKGKEFPIVFANVNSFTERELYLIMTRAQFELDLFSLKQEVDNKYLNILKEKNWVETKDIRFISTEALKKPVNIEKDEESKSTSSSQHSKENDDEVSEKEGNSNNMKKNLGEEVQDEEETQPKTKEQIPKHKKETTQYNEELDPDIITDEEKYQEDFTKKVQEDIKNFNEFEQKEIIKEIIVVRKKSTNKKSKELRDSIKNYLIETYKGYCQICGFTFRKVTDSKNSFEMFNWNDKRVVKQKKSFVTTADSLCLCRNCSANIKWGAFEPTFINKINDIDGFAHKSLEEIKDIVCVKLEDEVVDRFKKDYEWNDMYALEIIVNDEPKNIYMTNGHLIQFIAYLQLEER